MSQSVEWTVLESIHPTICVSNDNDTATLLVPVELGTDTPLLIVPNDPRRPALSASLRVLPPLRLRVTFPPSYPSHAPPIIQSLHATSAWLPLSILPFVKDRLIAMWSPGDDSGVLYAWVEWIRTGDFLADIGLRAQDTHTIQISHPSPHILLALLLAFASSYKSDEFARASYSCAICLSDRKGVHCLALSCGHVFCRTCLVGMWALHVKEGNLSHVRCPDLECGKTDAGDPDSLREATEDDVKAVLSESEFDRWKWLREKRDLERDPTVVYCPMEYCQEPVSKPKPDPSQVCGSDEDDSGWSALRTCPVCTYSFCAFCRHTWHGPHTRCPHSLASKFILDYLSAPPDSSDRHDIERRHGRGNVLRLVMQHERDQETKKWLDSSTVVCPGCEVRVEKSMGCNHMTCAKCKTHFCYRCGEKISAANPYQHFSTPHTPCFSRLFDLVPNAEDNLWQPVEGFEFV